MARDLFIAEKGIGIDAENGARQHDILPTTGAPAGASSPYAEAPIGSVARDTAAGGVQYFKIADNDVNADWIRLTDETIYTALGIAYGDEDFGTFTGSTLSDNEDAKTLLQELETALEAIAAPTTGSTAVAAATQTTINSVNVDNFCESEWEICVVETADETKRESMKVSAMHNGTSSADATPTDDTVHTKRFFAGNKVAGLTIVTDVSGTGAAQVMNLKVTTTNASTVYFRRADTPS